MEVGELHTVERPVEVDTEVKPERAIAVSRGPYVAQMSLRDGASRIRVIGLQGLERGLPGASRER